MMNAAYFSRVFRAAVLMALAWLSPPVMAQAESPLLVVASFSILGDMLKQVGGDKVELITMVERNADAHSFEPTPSHAKALMRAKLVVVNGLDFEAWMPKLLQAAGYQGPQLVASRGVAPLGFNTDHDLDHDHHGQGHGEHDPHAWQSLANAQIYVRNIAQGLAQADPANADYYQARAQDYGQRLAALDQRIQAQFAELPKARRKVITSHDAFAYFGKAYGIEFLPLLGVSSMAEPSASEMAALIKQAREQHISAIFTENVLSPKLAGQIAREVGAQVGGALYSDALGPQGSEAGTYLGMMQWNATQIYNALRP